MTDHDEEEKEEVEDDENERLPQANVSRSKPPSVLDDILGQADDDADYEEDAAGGDAPNEPVATPTPVATPPRVATPPQATTTSPQDRPTVGHKGVRGKCEKGDLPQPKQAPKTKTKTRDQDPEEEDVGFPKRFFGQFIDANKATWYLVSWYGPSFVVTASPSSCFKLPGSVKSKHPMLVGFQHHLRGMFPKQGAVVLRQNVAPDPVVCA